MTDGEADMLVEALLRRGGARGEDSSFPLIPLLQRLAKDGHLIEFASALDTYLSRYPTDRNRILSHVPGILAGSYFGHKLGSEFHSRVQANKDYGRRIEQVARHGGQLEAQAEAILEEAKTMTTSKRNAMGACLTVLGDRFSPIMNEIGRGEYPADLDERIQKLADDLEASLENCGELTEKCKARLTQVPEEIRLARALLAEKNDFRVGVAFQRAMHRINDVSVDCSFGQRL